MRIPPTHLIAYVTAALTAATGGALLFGLLAPTAPHQLRFTLGVVLVLLAVYRVAITRARAREESHEE